MINDILQGIAGFAGGALNAHQQNEERDRAEREKEAQLSLQRQQLARAIANDQSEAAHRKTMEEQGAAQVKRLDDTARFAQSKDMLDRGFKGLVTEEQLQQFHPMHQQAFAPEQKPTQQGFVDLVAGDSTPETVDSGRGYLQRESESERMAMANLRAQTAQQNQAAADARAAAERGSRESMNMARILAAGNRASQPKARGLISGDANRMADVDTSLDDVGALREALGDAKGETSTGFVANLKANWTPNFVTEMTGGWGADEKSRQGVIDRVKQVIGKTLEGGVLRKEDEIKYEKILPTIWDPPDVARNKLNGLESALLEKRSRMLESYGNAGYDVSNFDTTYVPRRGRANSSQLNDQMPGTSPSLQQAIAGAGGPRAAGGGAPTSGYQRFLQRQGQPR